MYKTVYFTYTAWCKNQHYFDVSTSFAPLLQNDGKHILTAIHKVQKNYISGCRQETIFVCKQNIFKTYHKRVQVHE